MTVVSFNTEATIHIPADDDGVTIYVLVASCTAYKLLWDKTDCQEYENTFNCILTQNMDKSEEDTIDKKLDYLTRIMCETAEQIVLKCYYIVICNDVVDLRF
jgi:hypothetical protein